METTLGQELQGTIAKLNELCGTIGMREVRVVEPRVLKSAPKNARYFDAEKMHQLVRNIASDGALESVPLVWEDPETKDLILVSGHHRVEAAGKAGLQYIMVMVTPDTEEQVLISKQLAHNALVGKDDEVMLAELFNSIKDVQLRLATGLADEAGKVSLSSLNFKLGKFKELVVLFIEDDVAEFDEMVGEFQIKSDAAVRVSPLEHFEVFAEALRKVKKIEDIKSNGTAMMVMAQMALAYMREQQLQEQTV